MSVPKLRFKEFSQEWKLAKAGEAFNSRRTKGEDGIPIYSVTLDRGMVRRDSLDRQILDDAADGANLRAQLGDLVYNMMRMWQGAVGLAPEDCMVSPAYVVLAPKVQTSAEFFNHWFKSKRMIYLLWAYSQGLTSDRLRLYFKDFAQIPLHLPTLAEQTKIATFLTSVDVKIAQLTQKCDLLTQYKKGVMQQIFSQELRFKDDDGRDYPEWMPKKFGEAFAFFNTNSFSRELLTTQKGSVKNIHYGDIHTKFRSNFIVANEDVPYISETVSINNISPENYCQEGDLVVADASEDYNDVGKAIEIISLSGEKLLAGLHTYIARDKTGLFSAGFKGYLMQAEYVRLQVKKLAAGVSVLGISKSNLAKVNINLPCNGEQTKIANLLTAIDDKITNAQAQLAAAKQYKQGLLQQMFV